MVLLSLLCKLPLVLTLDTKELLGSLKHEEDVDFFCHCIIWQGIEDRTILSPPTLSLTLTGVRNLPSCRRKTSMSLLSSWGTCFHDPMHYGQLGKKLPEVLKAAIDSGPEEPLLSGDLSLQPL